MIFSGEDSFQAASFFMSLCRVNIYSIILLRALLKYLIYATVSRKDNSRHSPGTSVVFLLYPIWHLINRAFSNHPVTPIIQ